MAGCWIVRDVVGPASGKAFTQDSDSRNRIARPVEAGKIVAKVAQLLSPNNPPTMPVKLIKHFLFQPTPPPALVNFLEGNSLENGVLHQRHRSLDHEQTFTFLMATPPPGIGPSSAFLSLP